MTRFDADTPDERRDLFAAAVRAHRERDSPFLTIEPEATPVEEVASETTDPPEDTRTTPWLQFADDTVNLDCTDAELDRLKGLLDGYPGFRIDELAGPDEDAGTNVRITARADPERLADFFDGVFLDVYGREEDYRAWAVEI